MRMRPFGQLVPVDEAIRRTMTVVRPLGATETVGLVGAIGRVAAADVRAPTDVPRFARATWDGYALRSADTKDAAPDHPRALRIVGEVYAEARHVRPIRSGEAVAIATGGALPSGADAVEIVENVRERLAAVEIVRHVPPGEKVAAPGDDFARGTRLVAVGEVLAPAALGAVAAAGRRTLRVRRRPRVAIVPNGNELVAPGRRLGRGQIHESNNATLGALIEAEGGVPVPSPPVRDDAAAIERRLRAAVRSSDLVIATGGSSVGEHDYLPEVFPRLGRLLFHGVSVRPGKPTLACATTRGLVLGFPGHPTSCLANGLWLLLPVLRRLAGLPGTGWIPATVALAAPIAAVPSGMTAVVPLRLDAAGAHPTFRDSSAITSLAGVNAYALRPPGSPAVPAGGRLGVRLLLPPLGAPLPDGDVLTAAGPD